MTNLLLALILFVTAAAYFLLLNCRICCGTRTAVLLSGRSHSWLLCLQHADIDWVSCLLGRSTSERPPEHIIFGLFALAFVVGLIIEFFKPENLLRYYATAY